MAQIAGNSGRATVSTNTAAGTKEQGIAVFLMACKA